ncbi:glycosyltransferase family 2 protein [Pedobacter borealis]|uniref:glycosyltransferase family 2 protein n=1 Tax=Pedobacter borealis TaxID=475254 RepID=UPI00049324A8|nr:glycosyltransferase family 2 protein [Pedobacter borealis]
MNIPLVSIALCTYNGEKYLRQQLDSIVNQTYPNLEIVVVDDVSSDNTIEILNEYALKHTKFRIIRNELNLGYVKNFEKAIGLCNGEYISLSDQDDIWSLDKIQLLKDNIGANAMIYHDSEFIDQTDRPMNKRMSDVLNMYEGNSSLPFLFYNCVSGHSALFKRSLSKNLFPFPGKFYHDWWMAFVATENGGLKYLDQTLVLYRQHSTSNTDILNIKARPKKTKKGIVKEIKPDWLAYCIIKTKTEADYINQLLSCFDSEGFVISRMRLFFLLLKNYKLIFYLKKKNGLSKLNYIRKMCFS